MLLTSDETALLWMGVQPTEVTMIEALRRVRGRFGASRPAYRILRDIFANERNDLFVYRLRVLIWELPYKVTEAMKIEIVYSLCDRKI